MEEAVKYEMNGGGQAKDPGTDIKLVQVPVIQHQLKIAGESVTKRLKDLDVDNLVATTDTVKALKELRADLNKELKNYEEQRKMVKKAISDPYVQFEELYKTEISEKYEDAVSVLKEKISGVEIQMKDEKRDVVESYFNELCAAEKIDFLQFDDMGVEINLSTTLKKYREQVNDFVSKVQDELALIDTHEHKAEILVEYKQTLNAAQAINTVVERKQREAEEQERIRQARTAKRVKAVTMDLGMTWNDMLRTYEYGDGIIVSHEDLEKMSDDEYRVKFIELETEIKTASQEETKVEAENPATPDQAIKPAAPVAKPVAKPLNGQEKPATQTTQADPSEKIVTASFEVKGTYGALKALGEYMRTNNITYKNI